MELKYMYSGRPLYQYNEDDFKKKVLMLTSFFRITSFNFRVIKEKLFKLTVSIILCLCASIVRI